MNPIQRKTLLGLVAATLLGAPALPAAAQLSLAPTFVYIDSPDRFGSVVVTNGSSTMQEVTVDFTFGYTSVDSLGNRFIQYDDAASAAEYELSPWIRSFPERFRIEPGRRQVVRMMLQPPADLEDGVYWTRMKIVSRENGASDRAGKSRMSAQVDIEVKQVIPVVYRKGRPTTGVRIADLRGSWNGTAMDLQVLFEREGDVPFIGTADLKVLDGTGRTVKEISTSAEVYFSSSTHFRLEGVPAGDYIVEVTLMPRRPDVTKGRLPHMEPVTRRFELRIPDASTELAHGE